MHHLSYTTVVHYSPIYSPTTHRECLAAQGDAFAEALRGFPVDQWYLNAATSWTNGHAGHAADLKMESNLDCGIPT